MNRRYKVNPYLMIGLVIMIFILACGSPDKPTTHNKEQKVTEDNQRTLIVNQPQPDIDYSLERANLIRRMELSNDANKLGWVCLMTNRSVIVGCYPVKGKITGINSLLSNPEQIIDDPNGHWQGRMVSAPQEDGSYGNNGRSIFFFTPDGTYIEWNGTYMYQDHEFILTQPPVIVYDITPEEEMPPATEQVPEPSSQSP